MLRACGRSGRQSVQQWLRLASTPHDFANVHPEEAAVCSVAGWLGFGSNSLVPNLSPTLASLLSLRRAASSGSSTLPAELRSRGAAGNSVKDPAGAFCRRTSAQFERHLTGSQAHACTLGCATDGLNIIPAASRLGRCSITVSISSGYLMVHPVAQTSNPGRVSQAESEGLQLQAEPRSLTRLRGCQ